MHRSKGGDAAKETPEASSGAADGRRSAKFQEFLAKWKAENVGQSEEDAYTKWVSLGEGGAAVDTAASGKDATA